MTNNLWASYKKEILGAILGSLLTGVLSLSIGLYNLNKSFEFTQKKELYQSLRSDIARLRKIDADLDENMNFLLKNNYKINYSIEPLPPLKLPPGNAKDEKFFKDLMEYMSQVQGGGLYKIKNINIPTDPFIIDAWQTDTLIITNINFDLTQELNQTYRILKRINNFLKDISTLSKNDVVPKSSINNLDYVCPLYNQAIDQISQKKILNLKNNISKEIQRLQKELTNISL